MTRQTQLAPASSAPRRGSEYAQLSRQIKQAGLLERRPGYYAWKIAVTVGLLAAGWAAFVRGGRLLVAAGGRRVPGGGLHPDRLPRPRRRAPADLRLPAGQLRRRPPARQPRHRAELRLVGRQAQPAPRAPQHRGRGPRHRASARWPSPPRRRAPAGAWPGWSSRYQAYLFFPMLLLRSGQPARREHPRADQPGRAGAGLVGGGCCSPSTSPATSPSCCWCCRRSRPSVFIVVQQGLFGLYLGCSFAPNHKGMPILDRGRPAATSCAARCSPPATSAAAG